MRNYILPAFIFFILAFLLSDSLPKASADIKISVNPIVSKTEYASNIPSDFIAFKEFSLVNKISLSQNKVSFANNNAFSDVGKPIRLSIPKINVNAKVEHIGLTSDGAVGVPDGAWDVSWFDIGPRPGQNGSAVISGHSGIWRNCSHSIFDNLSALKPGDEIYVEDDNGIKRSFVVKETRVYGKNETVPEIFKKSDKAYLNIITCYCEWLKNESTYSKRFVVFAQLQ